MYRPEEEQLHQPQHQCEEVKPQDTTSNSGSSSPTLYSVSTPIRLSQGIAGRNNLSLSSTDTNNNNNPRAPSTVEYRHQRMPMNGATAAAPHLMPIFLVDDEVNNSKDGNNISNQPPYHPTVVLSEPDATQKVLLLPSNYVVRRHVATSLQKEEEEQQHDGGRLAYRGLSYPDEDDEDETTAASVGSPLRPPTMPRNAQRQGDCGLVSHVVWNVERKGSTEVYEYESHDPPSIVLAAERLARLQQQQQQEQQEREQREQEEEEQERREDVVRYFTQQYAGYRQQYLQ